MVLPFEELRHDLDVGREAGGHQRLDVHVLTTQPVGILAGHEGGPGGGAGGLDVVGVQQDTLAGQLLQAGAVDVGVVPGHVVPAFRSNTENYLELLTPTNSHLNHPPL